MYKYGMYIESFEQADATDEQYAQISKQREETYAHKGVRKFVGLQPNKAGELCMAFSRSAWENEGSTREVLLLATEKDAHIMYDAIDKMNDEALLEGEELPVQHRLKRDELTKALRAYEAHFSKPPAI